MNITTTLSQAVADALKSLYGIEAAPESIVLQDTRKEFKGDYTLVVFPYVKQARKSPEAVANEIGEAVKSSLPLVEGYNVIKGFLNFEISDGYWTSFVAEKAADEGFGLRTVDPNEAPVVVEYSSPNTNKPLHLGHIRNNLLGWSVSQLLAANGANVKKVNLVNDRGIHICKSMLAWLRYGNGETPESTGMKGDHLVGKYYVEFDKHYKEEIKKLMESGVEEEQAKKEAPLMVEAQQMLKRWEEGDKEVRALWEKMNGWVYAGFDETYRRLGVGFDKVYYESNTYLLGKELVQKGLDMGVFVKDPDGSVWCDLTSDGLDRKLLLRSDGTSVYMTQDLGTAERRFAEYKLDSLVYVVGDEQNYHFQVLKLVLGKLGFSWADQIFHLSYGMVELPEGKMKSREGTVVDADDLIEKMYQEAKATSEESGKLEGIPEEEKERLFRMIGLGALKYFILKVDPKKKMLFNPKESIDFNGNTGPFIQYTHARICSILRKAGESGFKAAVAPDAVLSPKEIRLVKILSSYPQKVSEAAAAYSPALIANFAYDLAKEFNQYYHETPVLKEPDAALLSLRLALIGTLASTLRRAMGILGIELPERM